MLVTSVQPKKKKKKKLWTFNNSKPGAGKKIPLFSREPRVQQKSVQSPMRNFSSLLWPTASHTRSKASESRETTSALRPHPLIAPTAPHTHARGCDDRRVTRGRSREYPAVRFSPGESSSFTGRRWADSLSPFLPPPSLLLSATHTVYYCCHTHTHTRAHLYHSVRRAAGTWAMFLNGERWFLLQEHPMTVWS